MCGLLQNVVEEKLKGIVQLRKFASMNIFDKSHNKEDI